MDFIVVLIINFFLGAHDWFHLPIPIWIAVESIVGTVRLRCQMVAQASAIKNAGRSCRLTLYLLARLPSSAMSHSP